VGSPRATRKRGPKWPPVTLRGKSASGLHKGPVTLRENPQERCSRK
jgi:hypothetical protein